MYVVFVLIVLVADVYHRAVVLPRIRHDDEICELERQLDAERVASELAGDSLNAIFEADSRDDSSSAERTCATAPPRITGGGATATALTAVLAALSNYGDVGGNDMDVFERDIIPAVASAGNDRHHHNRRHRHKLSTVNGLGIDSSIDGSKSHDRPIVLESPEKSLSRKHDIRRPQPEWDGLGDANENRDDGNHQLHSISPYHFMMEDEYNSTDSTIGRYLRILCIRRGSSGYPAHNWMGAFYDGRQELIEHFRDYWSDIMDDEESNQLERFLLILEYPMTLLRKVCMMSVVLRVGMEIY